MSDFVGTVIKGDGLAYGLDSGLWQNVLTEAGGVIVGVAFTVFVVDLLRERAEKSRWLRAENSALMRLSGSLSRFSEENFEIKPGPRRSQDRILREAEQLYRTIATWAQNSTLAFMLGGNRDFAILAELADTIQYAIFALQELLSSSKGMLKEDFHERYAKPIRSIFGQLIAAVGKLSKNALRKEQLDAIREYIGSDLHFEKFDTWEHQPLFAA